VESGREIGSLRGVALHSHAFQWNQAGDLLAVIGPSHDQNEKLNSATTVPPSPEWPGFSAEFSGDFASLWEITKFVPAYHMRRPIHSLAFNSQASRLLVNQTVWRVGNQSGRLKLRRFLDVTSDGIGFSLGETDTLVSAYPRFADSIRWETREGGFTERLRTKISLSGPELEGMEIYMPEKKRLPFGHGLYDDPELDPNRIKTREARTDFAIIPGSKRVLVVSRTNLINRRMWQARATASMLGLHLSMPRFSQALAVPTWFNISENNEVFTGNLGVIGFGFRAELWDLSDWKMITAFRLPTSFTTFHMSPDGRVIVIGDQGAVVPGKIKRDHLDGAELQYHGYGVRLVEVNSGRTLRTLTTDGAKQVIFSPDGQQVFIIRHPSERGELKNGRVEMTARTTPGVVAFDLTSDEPGRTLTELDADDMLPSHDGSLLLVIAKSAKSVLLDVSSGRELGSWEIKPETWKSFAISPDCQYVASGDEDGTLHLWDATTGVEKAHWQAHEASVKALTFHQEGHTLVSGGADGVLKLWNLPLIRKELAELGLNW
jgi:WD40 repeat protein